MTKRFPKDKCLQCSGLFVQHKVDYRLPDSWENYHNNGLCPDCSYQEHKMLQAYYLRNKATPEKERIVGIDYDKELKDKIRQFLCDNLGVLFERKNQCYKFINEAFDLNLTAKEIESITTIAYLRKHGFIYKHKQMWRKKLVDAS